MEVILSLDMATKKTGYAIFHDKDLIKSNKILTNIEESGLWYERMNYMVSEIAKIIYKESPTIIIIEDVPVHQNLNLAKYLCILQGMVLGICNMLEIRCITKLPSIWRKGLIAQGAGVKRDVQKEEAVRLVNKLYNKDLKYFKNDTKSNNSDDDIAEAILLGLSYIKEC